MIPKIIHYCWFGKREMSSLEKECIASWQRLCPDFKFVLWNEDNFDVEFCQFSSQAYEESKWAFVSDVARVYALYNFGGIYLDTDMLLIKSLDSLIVNHGFLGAENQNLVNAAIMGFTKNHFFLEALLKYYERIEPISEDVFVENTIPRIVTRFIKEIYEFRGVFDSNCDFSSLKVFPSTYFYPMPYSKLVVIRKYSLYVSCETVAVHLWNGTWVNHNVEFYLLNFRLKEAISRFLDDVKVGRVNYRYFKRVVYALFYK